MDNVIKLKTVKNGVTIKNDYYTDKTLGSFPAKIKKIHESSKHKPVYKEKEQPILTLVKGLHNG
jgi:hypothetical protein